MVDSNQSLQSAPAARSSRRRWLRRLGIGAIIALIMIGVAAWTVTRPWFLKARIAAAVQDMVGGEVTVGDATIDGGLITASDIVLRAPDVPGEAGEVFRIGRGQVRLSLQNLLRGQVHIEDVALEQVRLRLSESRDHSGRFNFMALGREWSDDEEATIPPPVRVSEVQVQVGVHDEKGFELRGQRRMAGEMAAIPGRPAWFELSLREIESENTQVGMISIHGQWNAETFEHRATIEDVELDERAFNMCPDTVRRWCQEMNIRGRLPSARVHWSPQTPFSAELEMEDMALTLPVDAGQLWARFCEGRVEPSHGLPRMLVERGLMRVSGEAFTLEDLHGVLASSETEEALAPVPYRVWMHVPSLRGWDRSGAKPWIEQLVQAGAFELVLNMDKFTLARREDGTFAAVELPRQVARVMEKFQITSGSMSAEVHVERGFAEVDDSGAVVPQPIRARGTATIRDAAGSYYKFPFPLSNVSADLEFDDDSVRVVELTSHGASGERIRITGRVAPPQQHAAVHLTIQATDLPLDERLRLALPEDSRRAFDSLFDRPRFEALKAAGLIRGEEAVVEAIDRHQVLSAELAAIHEAAGDVDSAQIASAAAIESELARLDRVIDAGPFELGGSVSLDLVLDRPEGPSQRTVITGTIDVQRAGVLHDQFGYPFHVLGGRLDWQRDRIAIIPDEHSDGLRIATLNGGVGTVTGEISTPRIDGRKHVQPSLRLDIHDDRVSELMFAAIPGELAADPWNDAAPPPTPLTHGGYFVRSLGLDARIDWAGDIVTAESGKTEYDFTVSLSQATLEPLDSLSRAVGSETLVWPEGFVLREGSGRVRVTPHAVDLIEYSARRGEGTVLAHGSLNLASTPMKSWLDVRFAGLECGEYLLPLVPASSAARVAELWSRHQPNGTLDAHLMHEGEIGGPQHVSINVVPKDISVLLDGQPVSVRATAGHLTLGSQRLAIDGLCVDLSAAGRVDGSLELNGEFATDELGDRLQVRGSWRNGRFESPLITEVLKRSGAEHLVPRYIEFDPQGEFSATFHHDSRSNEPDKAYGVTLHPESLSLSVEGQRIDTRFEAEAIVSLAPGRVGFEKLSGTHPGGEIALDGAVTMKQDVEADLTVAYRAASISPQLLACLPGVVRDSLQAIHFQSTGSIELKPSRWHARRLISSDGSPYWESEFDGVILTEGASFSAALSFNQLEGMFEIRARQEREGGELDIRGSADRVRIGGRRMTDASASIHLDVDRSRLEIPDFRADCFGGVVAASALIGLNDNRDYETHVDMVGVSFEPFTRPIAAEPVEGAVEASTSVSEAPGEMFGTFDLAGRRDEPAGRSGRSTIRVINARMAEMPLTLGVLHLMELMPPLAGSLDFANVQFFIEGDTAVFEQVVMESPTLELTGEGEMNIDTLELNLRFRSRGTMMVWSDLVTLFSDQLFMIEVTGPLAQPKARLVALPGMRKSQDSRSNRGESRLAGQPE